MIPLLNLLKVRGCSNFSLRRYKVESFISPLVSEACLFPAGSDCHIYCDHFRSPEDSEEVTDFPILILISRQRFFEALPPLDSSPPIPPLSFLFSTPCRCLSSFRSVALPICYRTSFCMFADISTAHITYISGARPTIIPDFEDIRK
jgi:hypothetical protein